MVDERELNIVVNTTDEQGVIQFLRDAKDLDKNKPIVCFGSFQDYLGLKDGMIKPKNEWVHTTHWDLVIFDEYHFGAWRDNAKDLFEKEDIEWKEKENDFSFNGEGTHYNR